MSNSPGDKSEDVTLEDGVWKDSFDKLLEPRPILREMNILKKDVRASFNMNSSIENCSAKSDLSNKWLKVPPPKRAKCPRKKAVRRQTSISTPTAKRLEVNPFMCAISPIQPMTFSKQTTQPANVEENSNYLFHATHVNPEIIVVDYAEESDKREKSKTAAIEPLEESEVFPLPKWLKKSEKPRPSNRRVTFIEDIANDTEETPENSRAGEVVEQQQKERTQSLELQPGKWRKTLHHWRRTHQGAGNNRKVSLRPNALNDNSVCFVGVSNVAGHRKSILIKTEQKDTTYRPSESRLSGNQCQKRVLEYCKQRRPLAFERLYKEMRTGDCRKIGEGAFGEVFIKSEGNQQTVLKVIPIEGDVEVNGEVQKSYEQILPEIIISVELCNLGLSNDKKENYTCGFVQIKKIACVIGKYPAHFKKFWEDYDNDKGSENDHPDIFSDKQIYVVLELGFSGMDLEAFQFNNAEQAFYTLLQIVVTLAVGEEAYQFEHRDLHWGNILILHTTEKYLTYKLNNKELKLPSKGVKATIIDYTLSRMTFNDCCLYNDLSSDEELFTASGDYQFDIYRMMRDVLKNNWETYEPKTNVFWISYIITKLLDGVSYKNTQSKSHTNYLRKLQNLRKIVLDFGSARDCAKYLRKSFL